MMKEQHVNVRMARDMVDWIDHVRAEQMREKGRAISRSDIVRDAVHSLAESYISSPLIPVSLMEAETEDA